MQPRPSRISQPGAARRPGLLPRLGAAVLGVALLATALPAQARSEYDPKRAGNPLRIVYYAVYPATLLLDWLIFRPAYYVGQCEPFHTIFGTERPLEDIERATAPERDADDDDSEK